MTSAKSEERTLLRSFCVNQQGADQSAPQVLTMSRYADKEVLAALPNYGIRRHDRSQL